MPLLILLLVVLLLAAPAGAARRPAADAELASLCRGVVERSQIRAAQHGPFELRASVRVHTARGVASGTFRLLWACDGEWRKELTFPGLTVREGESAGAAWEERSVPFIPWVELLINGPLDYPKVCEEPPTGVKRARASAGLRGLTCFER